MWGGIGGLPITGSILSLASQRKAPSRFTRVYGARGLIVLTHLDVITSIKAVLPLFVSLSGEAPQESLSNLVWTASALLNQDLHYFTVVAPCSIVYGKTTMFIG